ncbi:protein phosphatase 1 regulatory subunit 26 isoform X2 [Dendrobates tinctorius]|uniref:protein phosphatase 1 regulatory subunit 26 isoform X2 n=1 Tax=Dendrobates tinctorius TaxID=92724 RepID=UPI003CC93A4A
MFLLNAPPPAAFQTQWTPFGCNVPCRVPTSLPQPAQVASEVEGTIDSPQSDESSGTVTLEYERIMQKNRKGELIVNGGLRSSPAVFRENAREKATFIVPAHFRDTIEEDSDFMGLALESDSDDSVDRGIEEAIQEYLKNKGTTPPLSCSPAAKILEIPESDGEKVKSAQNDILARKSPVKMVTSPKVCDFFPGPSLSRCSSPDSVGSDDSFEESIKKEIEQFLIEKKLQNNVNETSPDKKATTSHSAAKLKPKPTKVEKPRPKLRIKGTAVKTVFESFDLLSKNLKSKAESCKSIVRPKTVLDPLKPNVLRSLPPASSQSPDLSDSSSDDGIEEAIQLYQLEKSRLEGTLSSTPRTSPEKDGKNTASDDGHCQMKISLLDPQKKSTDYRKRKLPNVKPTATQNLPNKRALHSGDEAAATLRVETATELMCAEAILDISKTILPSQPDRSFVASQNKPSAQPASPCSSDSSVDSDDSIEQEIRTFLANKAQVESLCVTSAKQPPKEQMSEPQKQPFLPNTKAAGTSKSKGSDNKGVLKDSPRKGGEPVNVDSSPGHSSMSKQVQGKTIETGPGGCPKLPCQAEDARHHIIQAMERLESSPGASGEKRKLYIKMRSNSSGDKSSSLDSDEDLDSAIKDLLRSKRKCKKRPKDGRPQCKKKVRFAETATRLLETVGVMDQKDCSPTPLVVKSCLVSSDAKDNSFKKSKTILKLKDEKKFPVGNAELSTVSKTVESPLPCASDKSVKISSALPDTQDSSSVDSDDSIEQEIRKFLADRARESAELTATQENTAPSIAPSVNRTEANSTTIKKEQGVLSSSVTETILQKVREKDRSSTPATHRLFGYKDDASPGVGLQQPKGIEKTISPVHNVIVNRECFVDPNRIARPAEKVLPVPPDRVLIRTGVNSCQGNIPISGNFVAGLKYISGTEQQLLLNVGKSGATRLATDFYNPGGAIAQLGNCQNKTLILEQPKVVQAPAFSLGSPMVHPALYVVTTKVVQETAGSLCLPINAATYDPGLNLMSIQYCPGQVASHTAPFSFQQTLNSDTMVIAPGKAGEIPTLITKARASETTAGLLDGESRCRNEQAEGRKVQKDEVSSIDPGWTVESYICLSPWKKSPRSDTRRRAIRFMSQALLLGWARKLAHCR